MEQNAVNTYPSRFIGFSIEPESLRQESGGMGAIEEVVARMVC
ncbi:hypothetical protein [Hydrocoleum sp. CS-953]|nr:hypothetical protein [Hydrocoleum sp. CS-953]